MGIQGTRADRQYVIKQVETYGSQDVVTVNGVVVWKSDIVHFDRYIIASTVPAIQETDGIFGVIRSVCEECDKSDQILTLQSDRYMTYSLTGETIRRSHFLAMATTADRFSQESGFLGMKRSYESDVASVTSVTSDSSVETCSTEQLPRQRQKRTRRSVHFEHGDGDCTVTRRVIEVESVLNLADKSELWVQPTDFAETIKSIREESLLLREDGEAFRAYLAALAEAYCMCCQEDDEKEPDSTELNPSFVALLSLARGLESCSLPELAVARGERRRHFIQSIVQLDLLLRSSADRDLVLSAGAKCLSCGGIAKRFALALGAADAAAASAVHEQMQTTPVFTPSVARHVRERAPR